ncbi:MAG: GHKL domain-containing protein, partial [Deltaproteobacteria bacterium]|nr:GHKL domain-containing protein [Deltaproteobacteria bacterium]
PYAELSKRIDLMLKAMEDGAARIKKIISELKDFSRPTETDMESEIDVNLVVEKSLNLTHSILKKATRHLSVDYGNNLPKISGNSQKLQQVIINLLVNACQALENPKQFIHVKTSKISNASFIVIEVSDSGPGVPPKNLEKLKNPFFTTRRDDGGTGLGLSISEKIVNDHKGILEFTSKSGEGLTVKILLPIITEENIISKNRIS